MKTEILNFTADQTIATDQSKKEIVDYYKIAGPDYQEWSKNFNMHFGYFKWGMNPFDLERMLNQMNEEVYQKLKIKQNQYADVVDLGCGLGASARYFVQKNQHIKVKALTIVPWQIEEGKKMNKRLNLQNQVEIVRSDYTATPFANEAFNFAYAIESSCYAEGKGKSDLIREMSRILKSGGSFVVTDGFLKHNRKLPWWLRKIYARICDAWAVPDFGEIHTFIQNLKDNDFIDIEVKETSWNIAPSVGFIPYTTLKFLWKEIWKTGSLRLAPQRYNNVVAPILGIILGMARWHFGYYIISGTKK